MATCNQCVFYRMYHCPQVPLADGNYRCTLHKIFPYPNQKQCAAARHKLLPGECVMCAHVAFKLTKRGMVKCWNCHDQTTPATARARGYTWRVARA